METTVAEIADGIYRLSTYVPDVAPPAGFTFNQFLIDADAPLLFHCGPRAMFPSVSRAAAGVMPIERIRWISFGHVEADECGSMNAWLAACPQATVAHGMTACMVSLNDLADRAPRTLADGETIDLGGKRIRYIDTPHVPHGWEAGLLFALRREANLGQSLRPAHQQQRSDRAVHDRVVLHRLFPSSTCKFRSAFGCLLLAFS